ncbi:hypothetical protein BDR04DRAFT_1123863 [Suillus decipiens]|nr:hypothetical protein BDR04DRAFT_1123863 [Suillus decipiens]
MVKEQAAKQAKIRDQQESYLGQGQNMTMDKQGDEDEGEEEVDSPVLHPKQAHKAKASALKASEDLSNGLVVHEVPCTCCEMREMECIRLEGQGCNDCMPHPKPKASTASVGSSHHPTAGPKTQVVSSCGSEGLIMVSDVEDSISLGHPGGSKPYVMIPTRKRKLAEVEEEDFVLANFGLQGDDLVMAGKLWGVHAKFHTIQGLMAKVANKLDMMRAHLNRKARS